MLEVYERLGVFQQAVAQHIIPLTHEQREKGRFKGISEEGVEARIFLDRGRPLLIGEYLKASNGDFLKVAGAKEIVLIARCVDWKTFSKACYHLGNRHVKVEVGDCWLRIAPDHVLQEMLELLGLTVQEEEAVFVPESGAYSGRHKH